MKNLAKETVDSSEKLKALFEPFGTVTDAQIKARDDGKPLGLGFVVMASEDEAKKAIADLNDKELNGKKLSVAPAERRADDTNEWSSYPDPPWFYTQMMGMYGKGKGKGKDKGKAMMAQYAAMQAAYAAAYSQMWSTSVGTGDSNTTPAAIDEQVAPGEYTGVLKYRLRYGQKKSYLICQSAYQYYGSDIHIEKDTIPEEAKDGDTIRFTVASAYGEVKWNDKSGWTTPYARGYPKAKTARLVPAISKAEEKAEAK